jgi:hypothetical protein
MAFISFRHRARRTSKHACSAHNTADKLLWSPPPGLRVQEIQARIIPESIIRYGRFHMTGDRDNLRTTALIDSDPIARNNSYVKVCTNYLFSMQYLRPFVSVRSFARCQYSLPKPARCTIPTNPIWPPIRSLFSHVQQQVSISFVFDWKLCLKYLSNGTHTPYLLARVTPCNTRGLYAVLCENLVVTFDSAQMARRSPGIIRINTLRICFL